MSVVAVVRFRKLIVIAVLPVLAAGGLQWRYRHPPQRTWPSSMLAMASVVHTAIG